jgi:hypothetical protein
MKSTHEQLGGSHDLGGQPGETFTHAQKQEIADKHEAHKATFPGKFVVEKTTPCYQHDLTQRWLASAGFPKRLGTHKLWDFPAI